MRNQDRYVSPGEAANHPHPRKLAFLAQLAFLPGTLSVHYACQPLMILGGAGVEV